MLLLRNLLMCLIILGQTYPQKGDQVSVHYTGTLLDGTKFDSSRDRGQPFSTKIGVGIHDPHFSRPRSRFSFFWWACNRCDDRFDLFSGMVIKCWDEGFLKISLGEKANLHCGSAYAYGKRGAGGSIPPNSDLNFEVELLKIN